MKPLRKPRGKGHPTKLTPETHAQLIEMIRQGIPWEIAAQSCNVSPRQFLYWCQRGNTSARKRDMIYREFAIDVAKAKADAIKLHTLNVAQHAYGNKDKGIPPNPQISMWFLERRAPEHFGRREYIEHTGQVTQRSETVTAIISDPKAQEHVNALLEQIRLRKDESGKSGNGGIKGVLGSGEAPDGGVGSTH